MRFDFETIGSQGLWNLSGYRTPGRRYDRQWAVATMAAALERVRAEFRASAREDLFHALQGTLTGADSDPYAHLAIRPGMTEGASKTAAHRLRKRYPSALNAQVTETVVHDADPGAELPELLAALAP